MKDNTNSKDYERYMELRWKINRTSMKPNKNMTTIKKIYIKMKSTVLLEQVCCSSVEVIALEDDRK